MKKERRPTDPREINYLYFSFLLVVLLALTISHFSRVSQPLWSVHLFFLCYALGQALLEVLCLILIGYCLRRWTPRWTHLLYVGLSFAFLLAHFANFTLVRLMDVTLSYFFKFCFGLGLEHFRVSFQSMNLNSTMVGIIIGAILLVPLAGIAFYWITQKVSLKNPLILSQKQIISCAALLGSLLLLLDFAAQPYVESDYYNKYSKALPLGSTFLTPIPRLFPLPSPICSARSEEKIQSLLASETITPAKRPNVYLFVIETLRRDFIDPETAPFLNAFAEKNISPEITFANSNNTLLSWYAIFHSSYPYNWTAARDTWNEGSVPLQIFKKMGYKIRVYSSADLLYFNMDRVLFGKNRQAIDSIQDYSTHRNLDTCERDALSMQALSEDVEKEREGTLYIVFLDSTHSEYSCPANFPHPFQPAAVSIDYLTISQSAKDLELLKNRYRNSIHWVDHLIGSFFDRLKTLDLYDDAIITLTGDHGEEFFEDGALFHGTHLNDWQTRVPLFYKFPEPCQEPPKISTHMDIFPSILHYLSGRSSWKDYFDGESLFAENRWPFILSVQHNGPDVPYEFSLSDGKTKLLGRFLNPPLIHTIPGIELLALQTAEGREAAPTQEMIYEQFPEAFLPLVSTPEK